MWIDGSEFNWSSKEAANQTCIAGQPESRRSAGTNVPAGTLALVRSPLALRCSREQNALHTLIHQRHLTPSCRGQVPTAERTVDPARMFMESLTPRPELENSQGQSLHIDKPGPSARCPLYLQEPPNIRAAAKRRFVPEADSCSAAKGNPYSITSSARASRLGGTSRLSALAVLRLMTSSYLVGACTGRSAGFSPLRIRST